MDITLAAKERIKQIVTTSQSEATNIITQEELPAWRKVRDSILSLIDAQHKDVDAVKIRITSDARNALIYSTILALLP